MRLRGHVTESARTSLLTRAKALEQVDFDSLRSEIGSNRKFAVVCVDGLLDGELNFTQHQKEQILLDAVVAHEQIALDLSSRIPALDEVPKTIQKIAARTWKSVAMLMVDNTFPTADSSRADYLAGVTEGVSRWEDVAKYAIEKGFLTFEAADKMKGDGSGLGSDYYAKMGRDFARVFENAIVHESAAVLAVRMGPLLLDSTFEGVTTRELISQSHGVEFIARIQNGMAKEHIERIRDLTGEKR